VSAAPQCGLEFVGELCPCYWAWSATPRFAAVELRRYPRRYSGDGAASSRGCRWTLLAVRRDGRRASSSSRTARTNWAGTRVPARRGVTDLTLRLESREEPTEGHDTRADTCSGTGKHPVSSTPRNRSAHLGSSPERRPATHISRTGSRRPGALGATASTTTAAGAARAVDSRPEVTAMTTANTAPQPSEARTRTRGRRTHRDLTEFSR